MRISDWSSDVCSSDLLWIFAGPNGSGKSTVYSDAFLQDFDGSIWIINPDLLTTEIKERAGLEQQPANLAAVQRIEAWLHAPLGVRGSVVVATLLSTPKYRNGVDTARNHGQNGSESRGERGCQ